MAQRKTFDVTAIQSVFWNLGEVQTALARRDVGTLLRVFLAHHPVCTQTQLALLIEHDRAEVSNWVRGTRQGRVGDIDVLGRIADGLAMPDAARVRLGLAPQEMLISQFADNHGHVVEEDTGTLRVTICGSRHGGANGTEIDAVIPGLARLVLLQGWKVTHGPVGVGIEVTTYLADHYHPPGARAAVGTFGHHHVVAPADYILVIGGGEGTRIELDLALTMRKRVLPFARSGGAAAWFLAEAPTTRSLAWLSGNDLAVLTEADATTYPQVVHGLIDATEGAHQ